MSVEIIYKYFPNLTADQKNKMEQLQSLYEEWNAQINVISRKDMDAFYERHVLHSLGIAKVMQFKADTQIIDVGCGGGFPGIPLAIMFPECQFTLVDSIGKKIKVVTEVTNALGLENVTPVNSRAEQLKQKADFIVSRAVTRFEPFYGWVKKLIKSMDKNALPNGILYLKGGDLTEELKELTNRYPHLHPEEINLTDYYTEDFFETKKVVYVSA